jgi:NAD(P)-dependent dehydrogenase (short-subunit alcohol dehydrogenase family)
LRAGARVYISARKAEACDATAREPLRVAAGRRLHAGGHPGAGGRPAAASWSSTTRPESGWDKVADLNMKAPFFLTQALTPMLEAAATDHLAKVIHIASIDGISVNPWETYSYAASKAGLIHLTKRMAMTLAPRRIVVSAIAPGPFASDMNQTARDHADEVARRTPAGRIGTPEDMAGAAIYLASRAGTTWWARHWWWTAAWPGRGSCFGG